MTTSFRTSPFFIIGMPRSGTKLLRSLLNNHSDIHIPSEESEFIPYWLKKWNTFGNLRDMDQFVKFYRWTSTLPFFLSRDNRDKTIGIDHWYGNCLAFDPPGVFMGLLKSIAQHEKPTASVLGDKSPSYINELEVLKAQFPDAVMIHIVRDVRDQVMSFNRSHGKHPLRAAQRWDQGVGAVLEFAARHQQSYCEVLFEELLEHTRENLERICEFLGVSYHPNMEQINRPTENKGAAKGYSGIKRDNKNRYLTEMPESLRRQVEMLTVDTMSALGYPVKYSGKKKRLSHLRMTALQMTDGFRLVMNCVRQPNPRKSFYFLRQYWRTTAKLELFKR